MTVDIELDGTRRRVALRQSRRSGVSREGGPRAGERWIAGIDGREVEVSVVETGGRWSILVGPAKAGHYESHDVAFDPAPGGELIVHVNGVAVPVTVIDRRRQGRGVRHGESDSGPRTIVTPMAGRIVRVLVKPDEAVIARQPLVVVEAMKMENEFRAPRAGTVADVRVAEGASVEANTVLVVLR